MIRNYFYYLLGFFLTGYLFSVNGHQLAGAVSSEKAGKVSSEVTKLSELPAGQKILQTGRHMALVSKEIVRGSCWDYIDAVYNRAGYPQRYRQYILKGKKKLGPYAKSHEIQPGDWLYYINHSYHGVEHSGIFVRWIDQKKRIGLMLSYQGESKKKPGRYRKYDLSNVYTIIRTKTEKNNKPEKTLLK